MIISYAFRIRTRSGIGKISKLLFTTNIIFFSFYTFDNNAQRLCFLFHMNFTDANASSNERSERRKSMREIRRCHEGIRRHLLPCIHYSKLFKPLYTVLNLQFTIRIQPFLIWYLHFLNPQRSEIGYQW